MSVVITANNQVVENDNVVYANEEDIDPDVEKEVSSSLIEVELEETSDIEITIDDVSSIVRAKKIKLKFPEAKRVKIKTKKKGKLRYS